MYLRSLCEGKSYSRRMYKNPMFIPACEILSTLEESIVLADYRRKNKRNMKNVKLPQGIIVVW